MAIAWRWKGLTSSEFDARVRWLGEHRELGSGCESFFLIAARLFGLAKEDPTLATPAFFHAVIGLERALRVHYKPVDQIYGSLCEGSMEPFADLLKRAKEEGLLVDGLFPEIRSFPEEWNSLPGGHVQGDARALAELVPYWRNQYFHGRMVESSHFFFLALQLRSVADALKTSPVRTLLE